MTLPIEFPEVIWIDSKNRMVICGECSGTGSKYLRDHRQFTPNCGHCHGVGYVGSKPVDATICTPGSAGKIAVMAARFRNGKPLFSHLDATHEVASVNAAVDLECDSDYDTDEIDDGE